MKSKFLNLSGWLRSKLTLPEHSYSVQIIRRALWFEALKGTLVGEDIPEGYAALGARLGTTEAALKKAAQRLRERHHELLRAEVGRTVKDPGEEDEEIRCLFGVLCYKQN